jgi:hypothetical protein
LLDNYPFWLTKPLENDRIEVHDRIDTMLKKMMDTIMAKDL